MNPAIVVTISFVIALLASALTYALGSKIAPRPKPSPEKVKPYACGEDVPAEVVPLTIHLMNFAIVFLVFDMVAMVMAFAILSPAVLRTSGFLIAVYALVALEAILLLARRRW